MWLGVTLPMEKMMLITRKSILSGKVRTLDIPVTKEQLETWENSFKLIQEVMPHISPEEREFIMTGVTSDEWDDAFNEEEI